MNIKTNRSKTDEEYVLEFKLTLSQQDNELAELVSKYPENVREQIGALYKDEKLPYQLTELMFDAEHRQCQALNYDSDGTLDLTSFNKKYIKNPAHFVIEQVTNYIAHHFPSDLRRKMMVKQYLPGVIHKDNLYDNLIPYATNFDLKDQYGLCPEKISFKVSTSYLKIYTNVDYKVFNLFQGNNFNSEKDQYAIIKNCIYQQSSWDDFWADSMHCIIVSIKIFLMVGVFWLIILLTKDNKVLSLLLLFYMLFLITAKFTFWPNMFNTEFNFMNCESYDIADYLISNDNLVLNNLN